MTKAAPEELKVRCAARRLQFGMRGMFVMVTGACVLGAWVAACARQGALQGRAVEQIVRRGGSVQYDLLHGRDGSNLGRNVSRVPAWIQRAAGEDLFRRVTRASIPGHSLNAEHVGPLMSLPHVEVLVVDTVWITDEAAQALQDHPTLRRIIVAYPLWGNNGSKRFESLRKKLPDVSFVLTTD